MVCGKYVGYLLAGAVLAGCGGGSGGGSGSGVPVPAPAPVATVQSGAISRVIAHGTSIQIDVVAQVSNLTPAGTVYATATDSTSVLQVPVQVSSNGAGSYILALETVKSLTGGRHTGNVMLKLCSDQACNTPLNVPTLSVPYDLTVLTRNSAWPGGKMTDLSAWSGVADWATFQGNNAHTGYVPVEVKADRMSLRWKRAAVNVSSTGYNAPLSPLVTSNGLFYASGSNKLTAYKELDGNEVWNYDVSGLTYPSVNPPAIDSGVVYMAAGQQDSTFMFAFDAATGSLRFKSPMSSQWDHYLPPVVAGGAVYTNAGAYGGIYAFGAGGERLFYGALSQTSNWSPAADARAIYAYTGDALTMYEPKTGAVLATIPDNTFSNFVYNVGGAPVIGANGGVYAAAYANAYLNGGSMGNTLTRFDTIKGVVDWRVGGAYTVTPAYADGVLYAPNNKPLRLEARAEADGKLLWSWIPPLSGETAFHGAPVVTKNLVIVSSTMHTYALDLRTQKVVWSYPAAGHLAVSQNGILYIQSMDGLVAINLK